MMGEEDGQVMDEGQPGEYGGAMSGALEDLLGSSLGFDPEGENPEAALDSADAQDLAVVKLNGKDLQVPKEVAAALAQGRRFQGEKDRLEEANRRHQQEMAELRQQMQSFQQTFMQSLQQQQQARQPQAPSPIQSAFAQADEAVAAGSGVLAALGPVVEQYIAANTNQLAQKLDQILQASQQQQTRLQELDQQTHLTTIQQQVLDGIRLRQREDEFELSPEQQQEVVNRFMAIHRDSGYDRKTLQGQFLSAYYQTAFEAAKSGAAKPQAPGPVQVFPMRPPVGAPIVPRKSGAGVAPSFRRDAKLPSTVDLLQG